MPEPAPPDAPPLLAPSRVVKGQGRHPVPVILMARFGMEASPTDPLHLFLLFKDIRQSLESGEGGRG